MKKYLFAAYAVALSLVVAMPAMALRCDLCDPGVQVMHYTNDALYDASTFAPARALSSPYLQTRLLEMAQAATSTTTATQTPTEPASVTTVVKGGSWVADITEWVHLVFGAFLAGAGTLAIVKIRSYFGIKTSEAERAQLQSLATNGVNAAFTKVEGAVRDNRALDFDVKDKVVASAVAYVQKHGADTIKALGLDPQSGDAVEAIKARIETALNDPNTPTPAAVTPPAAGGTYNGVVIAGQKA